MPLIYAFFFWIYIPYKIIKWIGDELIEAPIKRALARKAQEHETDKAFGKLNHEIEIYDPDKDRRNAD